MPILRPILAMRLRPLALLSALLLPALSHAAGDAGSCKYVPIARMDIDFSNHAYQAVVTGDVNGKPARMLLDTGSDETWLLRSAADRLGVTLSATGRYATGIGGASVIYRANVNDFALGGAHSGKTLIPVLDAPAMQSPNDAIVGADYLLQTDMELSLAQKYMQFFRASDCAGTFLAYWDRDAMEIPFIGNSGAGKRPMVAVTLNGVKLNAILDTGAMRTVVSRHGAELAGVKVDGPGVRQGSKLQGIGDAHLDSWIADFHTFSIGEETVNNAEIAIVANSPQGESRVDVILGIDFLRAHHVLFAMSQRRVYLSYLGGRLFGADQQAADAAPKAP